MIAKVLVSLILINWNVLKTKNFVVFYPDRYDSTAKLLLKIAETYKPQVDRIVGYDPGNTAMTIVDLGVVANGFAIPFINSVGLMPYSEEDGSEIWLRGLVVHEYTHIAHLSQVRWPGKIFRYLFGNIYMPNTFSPFVEAITVYNESQLSPYEGRDNAPSVHALWAAKARTKWPSLNYVTASPEDDFPGASVYYLFPGGFFRYLAENYGEDKFAQFFNRYTGSLFVPFSLNHHGKKVYGKSFPQLFKEWGRSIDTTLWVQPSNSVKLADFEWHFWPEVYKDGKIYAVRMRRLKTASLMHRFGDLLEDEPFAFQKAWMNLSPRRTEIVEFDVKTGKMRTVMSLKEIQTPIADFGNKLYFLKLDTKVDHRVKVTSMGPISVHKVLCEYDISTERLRCHSLPHGLDRARTLESLPDGTLLIASASEDNLKTILWKFDPASGRYEVMGEVDGAVDEIKVSSDGKVALTIKGTLRPNDIFLFDISEGLSSLHQLTNTPQFELGIAWWGDSLLVFTAPYDGTHGILYALNTGNMQLYRLTHTGYQGDPLPNEDGLFYISVEADGNSLWKLKPDFEPVEFPAETSATVRLADVDIRKGSYWDIVKRMTPFTWIPFVMPSFRATSSDDGGNSGFTAGVFFGGMSPTFESYYVVGATYDTKSDSIDWVLILNTLTFSPVETAVEASRDEQAVRLGMPLYTSLSNGINTIYGMIGMEHKEGDYWGFGGFRVSGGTPSLAWHTTFSTAVNRDRDAEYSAHLGLEWASDHLWMRLGVPIIVLPDTKSVDYSRFDLSATCRRGLGFNLNLLWSGIPIKGGLGNPQFFVNRLYLGGFAEYHTWEDTDKRNFNYFYGFQAATDMQFLYVPFDLMFSIGWDKDGKLLTSLDFRLEPF